MLPRSTTASMEDNRDDAAYAQECHDAKKISDDHPGSRAGHARPKHRKTNEGGWPQCNSRIGKWQVLHEPPLTFKQLVVLH